MNFSASSGLALLLAALACGPAAARDRKEDRFALRICAGMQREVTVPPGGSRIDCVSATHAIEIDWTYRWAEAAGQAMHAGAGLGLIPGVALYCEPDGRSRCERKLQLLRGLFWRYRVRATIWACPIGAPSLEACRRIEVRR